MLSRVRDAPLGTVFLPALLYKVAMGWALGGIFFCYYQQGDTIQYFADARQLAQLAYHQPLDYLSVLLGQQRPPVSLAFQDQPRALFFAKVVSIFNLITHNNYWITSAYLSLLSFLGSWTLANYLARQFPAQRYAAAIAFLWYPSVVFWGSGVLKESLAVAAIAIIVYEVLRLTATEHQRKTRGVMLLIIAAGVLWKIKYYYAGVLFPTLLAAVIAQAVGQYQRTLTFPMFFISWLALIVVASLLHPVLALDNLVEVLLYNHNAIVRISDATNVIHFQGLNEHPDSFWRNLPLAVVSGLFRPWIGDGTTVLSWAAGVENTGLLLVGLGAAVNGWRVTMRDTDRLWIVAAITYVIVLGSLLAFASPNFGSLVRYKVAFFPFLVFLCLAGNEAWVRKVVGAWKNHFNTGTRR